MERYHLFSQFLAAFGTTLATPRQRTLGSTDPDVFEGSGWKGLLGDFDVVLESPIVSLKEVRISHGKLESISNTSSDIPLGDPNQIGADQEAVASVLGPQKTGMKAVESSHCQ